MKETPVKQFRVSTLSFVWLELAEQVMSGVDTVDALLNFCLVAYLTDNYPNTTPQQDIESFLKDLKEKYFYNQT